MVPSLKQSSLPAIVKTKTVKNLVSRFGLEKTSRSHKTFPALSKTSLSLPLHRRQLTKKTTRGPRHRQLNPFITTILSASHLPFTQWKTNAYLGHAHCWRLVINSLVCGHHLHGNIVHHIDLQCLQAKERDTRGHADTKFRAKTGEEGRRKDLGNEIRQWPRIKQRIYNIVRYDSVTGPPRNIESNPDNGTSSPKIKSAERLRVAVVVVVVWGGGIAQRNRPLLEAEPIKAGPGQAKQHRECMRGMGALGAAGTTVL